MASWRSGYAEDCKSLHPGSIPGEASTFFRAAFRQGLPARLRASGSAALQSFLRATGTTACRLVLCAIHGLYRLGAGSSVLPGAGLRLGAQELALVAGSPVIDGDRRQDRQNPARGLSRGGRSRGTPDDRCHVGEGSLPGRSCDDLDRSSQAEPHCHGGREPECLPHRFAAQTSHLSPRSLDRKTGVSTSIFRSPGEPSGGKKRNPG